MFDDDLRSQLVRHFSLKQLMHLKPMIPAQHQQWASEFMWTRAVLLGDFEIADKLTPDLMTGRNTTRHLYDRFKNATSSEEKKNAALIILTNSPELTPEVTRPQEQAQEPAITWSCYYYQEPSIEQMGLLSPAFLSPEERAKAEDEQKRLRALPLRTAYLMPQVIEWAKKNKKDPEAPKALHFLVGATRNECS